MEKIRLPIKIPASGPEAFIAPWPIELVSALPAPNYDSTHPRVFTRIAHVLVPNCKPGQLLDCAGTFQASNRLGEIVELSACLMLTPDATGVGGLADPFAVSGPDQPPNGRFISRFPGFNVTPNASTKFPNGGMHHAPFHLHARYVVPEGVQGDQYVAIVAYAAGLSFDSSRSLSVDPMCGDLSVLRFG